MARRVVRHRIVHRIVPGAPACPCSLIHIYICACRRSLRASAREATSCSASSLRRGAGCTVSPRTRTSTPSRLKRASCSTCSAATPKVPWLPGPELQAAHISAATHLPGGPAAGSGRSPGPGEEIARRVGARERSKREVEERLRHGYRFRRLCPPGSRRTTRTSSVCACTRTATSSPPGATRARSNCGVRRASEARAFTEEA